MFNKYLLNENEWTVVNLHFVLAIFLNLFYLTAQRVLNMFVVLYFILRHACFQHLIMFKSLQVFYSYFLTVSVFSQPRLPLICVFKWVFFFLRLFIFSFLWVFLIVHIACHYQVSTFKNTLFLQCLSHIPLKRSLLVA